MQIGLRGGRGGVPVAVAVSASYTHPKAWQVQAGLPKGAVYP